MGKERKVGLTIQFVGGKSYLTHSRILQCTFLND